MMKTHLYLLLSSTNTARRGHKISFCWVPAHVSVKENEKADELAKTGASRQVTACPVPHRDLFPTIRAAIHVVWQDI